MRVLRITILVSVFALELAGCAARSYRPSSISPSDTTERFEARTLDNSGLQQFLKNNIGRDIVTWPVESWDPAMLTLAGLYYHSDVAVARAGVRLAEAGVITAGARPNPSISVGPGITTSPESPWLFSFVPSFPIETAGKRGYRIQAAQRLTDVARLQFAETAWQVRARIRSVLLDLVLARETIDQLRSEEQVRTLIVRLLEQRLELGDIPRPELDTAQIELSNMRLAVRSAEGQLSQSQASLAAAIGVPGSALDRVALVWPGFDVLPSTSELSPDNIQRTAVLNRLDIRRVLSEYTVAEADLQLEIAKQYPDLQIGPGYDFDEGHSKFALGLSLTLPVFNRNQGPIAQAEASRRQTEERFLALQAQVIGESEKAFATYAGALAELNEASTALRIQQGAERLARQSFDFGETDNLTYTGIRLQTAVATRARLNALARAQAALGTVENAVQKPLAGAWLVPRLPSSDSPGVDLLKEERR